MKARKLNNVIFFSVTLVVFFAGTVFAALHRANFEKGASKENVIAVAAACFLTVAELALVLLHKMIDSRELWRRIMSYTLSLGLIATITYATYTEAKAFMEEGNMAGKASAIANLSTAQQGAAKNSRERRTAIAAGQETLKAALSEMKAEDFAPFSLNFFFGLFCVLTAGLIMPREPWKRKSGNQMNPQIKAAAEKRVGFNLGDGVTAYDDGKGASYIIKDGRKYVASVPKSMIE